MAVEIRPPDMDAVTQAIRRYGQEAANKLARDVTATALSVDRDIKQRIQRGPKSGFVYNSRGKQHQASAPGEAPATDTGTLVSSISFSQLSKLSAEVVSRLPYAYFLEFGTMNISPRPAWTPAAEKGQTELTRRIEKTLSELSK